MWPYIHDSGNGTIYVYDGNLVGRLYANIDD